MKDARKKISCEILHKRLGHLRNSNILYASKFKLWQDFYAQSTSDDWCTDCKIAVLNKNVLSKNAMLKPNEAHKWISINIVQNPYFVTSDRDASSDQYMLTI